MKEILPGIYTWHEYSEEKQLNFNGYFLVSGEEFVLIDPPRMTGKDIAELESLVGKKSANPLRQFCCLMFIMKENRMNLERGLGQVSG